jgi:hypothetical protein
MKNSEYNNNNNNNNYHHHLWALQSMTNLALFFFSFGSTAPIQALAASMKLSVSLQLLDLGESVELLGRVISSSQGLYLYTNTEKPTYNTQHPCPQWNLNPRSRCSGERRQFMSVTARLPLLALVRLRGMNFYIILS